MMVAVPVIGSRSEELLQDTLKSALVVLFVLLASFSYFWNQRNYKTPFQLHWILALPVSLMIYALTSMVWSHTYLGGVEAVRWFFFSVILYLGMNVMTQCRVTQLAWGIHLGAVFASLWAALQFWFDWHFFAQGPNPASTFVNRNFFAEYVVCTLPFSVLLLTRVRDKVSVFLLTFSIAFNVVALMMTGTRSALVSLLLLGAILPLAALFYRRQWVSKNWTFGHACALMIVFLSTIATLSSIPTSNKKLIDETGLGSAWDRATSRALSITNTAEYATGSFSIRSRMWKATSKMIFANPIAGVGAGAWEVHIPEFQDSSSQLETDYYAHNEPLQMIAEYGLTGWIFLVLLTIYLIISVYKTLIFNKNEENDELILRSCVLSSLAVLFLVSNAGFPWRLASTDAIFAFCLALLVASDNRLLKNIIRTNNISSWSAHTSTIGLYCTAICTGLSIYVVQKAVECESMLIRATKIALTISSSGIPNDSRWQKEKNNMLELLRQGIAINPHYRKLTPIAADAMAGWGDWNNALWIWKSMLNSRPFIIGMLANAARGSLMLRDVNEAQRFLDQAFEIQPESRFLESLQAFIWSQSGQLSQAKIMAQKLIDVGYIDNDLMQTIYFLGTDHQQTELFIAGLQLGIKTWPSRAADGWLKLGDIYLARGASERMKTRQAYQAALNATPTAYKHITMLKIPPDLRPFMNEGVSASSKIDVDDLHL